MSARTQYLIEQIEELRIILRETKNSDEIKQLNEQIKLYSTELLEAEKKNGNILLG